MTHAGIIAAGHGSRLQGSYPNIPKPLIEVAGRPIVHWVTTGLLCAGAKHVTILLNSSGDGVRTYLETNFPDLRWRFLRADTQSSWESFRLVSTILAETAETFLISTVDAMIPPGEVARFAAEAFTKNPAAVLALTRFVEDEKPLWADSDEDGRVTALGAAACKREAVTCGLYGLTERVVRTMPPIKGFARLRDFWTRLVESGQDVRGVLLKDTVDVDRPEDLPAAEKVMTCYDA